MGGSAVLHLFSGPTAADISKQYKKGIIGQIEMPPFWALGFHLCREADNQSVFYDTLNRMKSTFPVGFDSDCIDLRLSGAGSGSIDKEQFDQVEQQVQMLRESQKKFVLAQPPHVRTDDLYASSYVFINSSRTNTSLVGSRFDSDVFYPSFEETNQPINFDMSSTFNPDGIIFVDNYPSNDLSKDTVCNDVREFVPYRLNLTSDTICPNSLHADGRQHIQMHNLYGTQQVKFFVDQLNDENKRLLYLSRATSVGNMGLAGYPGDDSSLNWLSMKQALVQVGSTDHIFWLCLLQYYLIRRS